MQRLARLARSRAIGLVAVVALVGGMGVASTQAAVAADPTATMQVEKAADVDGDLTPGTEFLYTITVTCSAPTVSGCDNFVLTDPLPEWIDVVGGEDGVSVDTQPSTVDVSDAGVVTVDVNQALGGGVTGLKGGVTLTITIRARLDPDAPATIDGTTITNTATATADNANPKSDSADVTPVVETTLGAETTKEISPAGAAAKPGTQAQIDLTGTNTSNVPVHELVVQDPVDPTASPNPFVHLGVTTPLGDVTMPKGADQVVVWAYVDGEWVEGEPGPPATLPDGVDPADVQGLRYVFTDTTGDGIAPGATAEIPVTVEQRDNVTELAGPVTVTNDAQTTVTTDDGTSATSRPADDTYVITPPDLHADVTKTFDPATVHAGESTTVTIGATNSSNVPVGSLTVTEPSGTSNPFEGDNALTFTGFTSGVSWPSGATGASITYSGPGCSGEPQTTTTADTLPAPPAGCQPTGFVVTFTGSIDAGAEATLPFTAGTDPDQTVDTLEHENQVSAETGLDGSTSDPATDDATLTTLADRIATDTTKRITPSSIPAVPGQDVTTSMTGTVKDFPDSTVNAQRIVVQDPEDPSETPNFFDTFRPTSVDNVDILGCVQLTVNSWNGTAWVPVPGMQDLQGPQRFTGNLPADLDAHGLQFVYTPAAGCDGFPPKTSVSPNFSSVVRPDVPNADATVNNCAGTDGSAPTVAEPAHSQGCADVDLREVDPGEADLVDKDWDTPANVAERSGDEKGATLHWSTGGFSNFEKVVISDVPDPAGTDIADSVYDAFDLVRIDPITAADDPLLTYDQVTGVELYIGGQWVEAANDPCPAGCDGTFPGYTLTADERAGTTAFRLTFAESDTHRTGATGTPAKGTGVARSSGNDRTIHPVFALRDTTRHTPTEPVLSTTDLNTDQAGVVSNTVGAEAYFPGATSPSYSDQASDEITILHTDLKVGVDKTWDDGPLGLPGAGTPADRYPSGRATITATNESLSRLDTLSISEPADPNLSLQPSDPFDTFDLTHFEAITDPAALGATGVTVTVTYADGTTRDFTRDQALAGTVADFDGAVGFTVVYTGRIHSATDLKNDALLNAATVTFDTRLRATHRSDGSAVTAPAAIRNEASTRGEDLVGYPEVPTKTATDTDDATIDIQNGALTVAATKKISPASQTEGNRSPVTVTLTGQPKGPARTVSMVVEDSSPTFWNQYDFTGFSTFSFTRPIDQVYVDALTGGTWSVVNGEPVLTGATWKTGTPGSTPVLPAGVTAAQVQGLRFTYTRADGRQWQNPATPSQSVAFQVTRRETLNTGGPVLTDMKGNDPAPGETTAGRATNAITVDATSAALDADGNPVTAPKADATAHIDYKHLRNTVQIVKTPSGNTYQPGQLIPYKITIKNTGGAPIENPKIDDPMPADAQGGLLMFPPDGDPAERYAFGLTPASSASTAMPTDPADVTVAETNGANGYPTEITFRFPEGTILQPGETYTISFAVESRPGLAAKIPFTNTVGITADRPWDTCSGTVDPGTGACSTSAQNQVGEGAAIGVTKRVKAEDSDTLGVITDPASSADAPRCVPDSEGFYSRPCVPVTKPGGEITWRVQYRNTGNEQQNRIVAIDRLPKPGDTASTNDLARGSQWRPLLADRRPTLVSGSQADLTVSYATSDNLCLDNLTQAKPNVCPAGSWTLWPQGTSLSPEVRDSITAIQFVYEPEAKIPPLGGFSVDLYQTAPAFSPTAGADTIAFNSTGARAQSVSSTGTIGTSLTTEPPRVGVSLATGPIQVEKIVTGPAAEYAPSTFTATLECTSVGEKVDLGSKAKITLEPNTPVTVDGLPYGADCTVTESDASGQTSSTATHVTVERDPTDVPMITVTNVYEDASLTVTKHVTTTAKDQDGDALTYGPFQIGVECTFLDKPVYAAGYSSDTPMDVTLADGQSATFRELPAGAECTVTETAYDGSTVTYETTTGDDTSDSGTGTLAPDGDGGAVTNTTDVTNTFDSGALELTKKVEGDAADLDGAGPFSFHLVCTLDDGANGATEPRTVYETDVTLEPGASQRFEHIATGADCTVTETDDGGASSSALDPADGKVAIGGSDDDPVTVTATNTFQTGRLAITKTVDGDAGGFGATEFPVEVTCTADGTTLPGFPKDVTVTPGETTTVESLVGASCTVTETDRHGATAVTYDPADPDDASRSAAVTVGPAASDPVEVGITNTYDAGSLQVLKKVTGPAAEFAPTTFAATLGCTFDGRELDLGDKADLTLTPGTPVTVDGLPIGADCTVTETDAAGQTSWTSTTVTVTGDAQQVPVIDVQNVYEDASLTVTKHVTTTATDADGDALTYGPFEITVQCTFLDEPVYAQGYSADKPMVVKLADGEKATFTELPAGAGCTVTETAYDGSTVTYETTTGDDTSATGEGTLVPDGPDGPDGAVTNTTDVTNTFDSGSLELTKKVEGDAAGTYGAGPFTFHLVCTLDDGANGATGPRTVYETDVTLEPGASQRLEHVATGADCTVTETDAAGASSSALDPADGKVTIGGSDDDPVTVTATNTFTRGELAITKAVDGDAAGYAPKAFPVEVTCTADGATLAGFPKDVTVTPGETTTVDSLVGASCTVAETDPHGATAVTYDPADPDDATRSAGVVIGPADADPVTVGITNTYRAGGLQIAKLVDGPGSPEASAGPFVFSVTCTFDGETAYRDEVTLEGDGTSDELESDVLGPLPVGAQCVVREVDNGGADATPPPVTVTIPDVDEDGTPQVAVAGFVNEFSAGTIALAKKVDGDDAASAKGKTFTVLLTCQLDTPDGTRLTLFSDAVKIRGGETLEPQDADGNEVKLPLGTHCFARETDNGGATSTTVSNGSFEDAAVVGISSELQPLTVTVVNTFTKPPVPPTPTPTPPGSLPQTGADVVPWAVGAAVLLLLGAALVLLARHRREE